MKSKWVGCINKLMNERINFCLSCYNNVKIVEGHSYLLWFIEFLNQIPIIHKKMICRSLVAIFNKYFVSIFSIDLCRICNT